MTELFKSLSAVFFDENGEYHGKKGFSKHDRTFKYGALKKEGAYNIDLKASYTEEVIIPFIWTKRKYYYNTKNSNPLKLDKSGKPPIDPELYNIQLETKVMRDLNDLSKKSLLDFLNPKTLIILLIAGIIIYYVATGNKLF